MFEGNVLLEYGVMQGVSPTVWIRTLEEGPERLISLMRDLKWDCLHVFVRKLIQVYFCECLNLRNNFFNKSDVNLHNFQISGEINKIKNDYELLLTDKLKYKNNVRGFMRESMNKTYSINLGVTVKKRFICKITLYL